MIKIITVNSSPGLAADAATAAHAPSAQSIRRLTVNWPIDEPVGGKAAVAPPGAVECRWFDDEAAALAAHGCASFADLVGLNSGQTLVTTENVVLPGPSTPFPAGGVKLVAFVR